jgi:ribose/xylose/arabinose/galactoside ABC-type transport system permease subunit
MESVVRKYSLLERRATLPSSESGEALELPPAPPSQGRPDRDYRGALTQLVPLLGLVGLVTFFTLTAGSRFMTVQNWLTLIQQASVIAIVGFGATFVIVAGSIDLSVGSVIALSGMVAAGVGASYGGVAGLLAGLAIGGIVGLVNGLGTAFLKVPSFIVTLGMLSIAKGTTLLYSHSESKSIFGTFDSLGDSPGIYCVLGSAFVLSYLLFNQTTFGRYARAIGGDERVARLSGVPVNRVKVWIFIFGGVMAGLGGVVLSARLGVADPQAGNGFELMAISAVVIGGTPLTGGIGNVWNTVIGALLIQVLANGLAILGVAPEVQRILQGVIIIVAVLVVLDRRRIGIIK